MAFAAGLSRGDDRDACRRFCTVRAPAISLFGWHRATWQAGAGLVAVGFVTCLGLAVAGLVIVGAVEFLSRQHRAAGTALVIGPLSWLTVWLRGARFDSEDSPPLDALERLLSTAGLG